MENDAPYEIIAAPAKVWVAPVGTDFPVIDAVPNETWTLLGKCGDKNISEDGVTVSHPQSVEVFRAAGSTGPRKIVRTEEDLMISFTLWDLTLEMYRRLMNFNAITQMEATAAAAGVKKLNLKRGRIVNQFALIAEGPSPYGEDWNLRYKVPIMVNIGEPEIVFQKGEPAGLLFDLQAIEHETLGFGEIEAQFAGRV
ncbi:MAG: hypothetical protein PHS14_02895 [Elusimicrobia bacterium]|nr:hypothetical protein [Elusimicrobiota bacterium]